MAVVLCHWEHFGFTATDGPAPFLDHKEMPGFQFLSLFYMEGWRGVEYFFLLSGFVFFWLYRDRLAAREVAPRRFWLQRLARLWPLHLATLFLVIALQAWHHSLTGTAFLYHHLDLYHFLLQLPLASSWGLEAGLSFNGPVWSVSVEVLLYLVFFLLAHRGWAKTSVCLGIIVLSLVGWALFPHNLLRGLYMFFFGGILYRVCLFLTDRRAGWHIAIYVACVLSWLTVLVHYFWVDLSGPFLAFGYAGKALFTKILPYFVLFPLTLIALVLLEVTGRLQLKRFSWLGDITYSSYLIHFPMQLTLICLVQQGVLEPTFFYDPGALLLFVLVLIPLSYLVFRFFEKPAQKLILNKYLTAPTSPKGSAAAVVNIVSEDQKTPRKER